MKFEYANVTGNKVTIETTDAGACELMNIFHDCAEHYEEQGLKNMAQTVNLYRAVISRQYDEQARINVNMSLDELAMVKDALNEYIRHTEEDLDANDPYVPELKDVVERLEGAYKMERWER